MSKRASQWSAPSHKSPVRAARHAIYVDLWLQYFNRCFPNLQAVEDRLTSQGGPSVEDVFGLCAQAELKFEANTAVMLPFTSF